MTNRVDEAKDDSGEDVDFDWEFNEDGSLTMIFDDLEYVVMKDNVEELHKDMMKRAEKEE